MGNWQIDVTHDTLPKEVKDTLGPSASDILTCSDGIAQYRKYRNGAIYWVNNQSEVIYGLIYQKWMALGAEKSALGYPTSRIEKDANSGKGRYMNFQNGTILWKFGANEAFAVQAGIYSKYASVGFDSGFLGFPLTDEMTTPDGVGRYNHFEGGSIYWTPETSMHIVQGAIREAWASQGWEQSRLLYPVSDELVTEGTNGKGRHSNFEGGVIYWTPENGVKINLYPPLVHAVSPGNLVAAELIATEINLQVFSDGRWTFHAHLYDDSDHVPDSFSIGFVFKNDGHSAIVKGDIGCKEHKAIDISGNDIWFQKNWHKVLATQVHFDLVQIVHNESWTQKIWNDFKAALGWAEGASEYLSGKFKEYAPEIVALAWIIA